MAIPAAPRPPSSGGRTPAGARRRDPAGRAPAGLALGVYVHVALALTAISVFGTPEQKERYLRPGIAGERIGAWSFAEASAGSDPASIVTRAEQGDGGYRISGTKLFATNG